MSNKLQMKMMSLVGVVALATGALVGCSNAGQAANSMKGVMNEQDVQEIEAPKDQEEIEIQETQEEIEKIQDKEEAPVAEKEEPVNSTEGEITEIALPLFEELYAEDELKEFRLEYAQKGLAVMDQLVALMPENMKQVMFTSRGLVEYEGPGYEFNLQASGLIPKTEGSKEDNFDGVFSGVCFEDEEKYREWNNEVVLSFRLGSDTEMVLCEEAKQMLQVLLPDHTPEEVEKAINESIAQNGKTNYFIEEKNKKVTISSGINKTGTTARVKYEVRKDYPDAE